MYGRFARIDGDPILNPGLLRHQITWQRKDVTGQDSFGQDSFAWVDVLTCKARVQGSNSGRGETERLMQRFPEADFVITQHFSRGLEESMRIAWFVDGEVTYLDVLSIDDPAGTGRYQTVVCRNFGSTFTA